MKKTETSEYLPYELQNGERVRVLFMPSIEATIRATKSTATSVFYDLDIWPIVDNSTTHSRLYNVDSRYVVLFDPKHHSVFSEHSPNILSILRAIVDIHFNGGVLTDKYDLMDEAKEAVEKAK